MPSRATAPSQRRTRLRPRGGRRGRRRSAPAITSGQSSAEGVVQAGGEVFVPDAGVGRVVGDAEIGTAALQALGMGQRDRPEAFELGQRVAGGDQVAQVPVAAAGEGGGEPPAGRGPAPPGGRQEDHSHGQRRRHRHRGRLRADRHPDRQPGGRQRPARRQRGAGQARVPPPRPGSDQDRDRREQQGRGHQVVLGGARLAHHERVALQHDRGGHHSERSAAPGPTDAPGSQEGDRQPAEVDEQRQRVAVGEQDPGRVQQFGVLRVEPVDEDGLGVEEPVTEWLCAISVANGRWYQRESKLKTPRPSASFAVKPQWAKTTATTATAIKDMSAWPAGPGGGAGGSSCSTRCSGRRDTALAGLTPCPPQPSSCEGPPVPPLPAGDAFLVQSATTAARRTAEPTSVPA